VAGEKIEALKQIHREMLAAAQERVAQVERAKAELEAAAGDRIAAAEKTKQAAELEAKAAKENHEMVMNERLQEQREALENANPGQNRHTRNPQRRQQRLR
jgi:glucosamine 6-phosphate synthetase-like amidotransferase/phosphosugar isomerase protein